jgi:hypothetical protein
MEMYIQIPHLTGLVVEVTASSELSRHVEEPDDVVEVSWLEDRQRVGAALGVMMLCTS